MPSAWHPAIPAGAELAIDCFWSSWGRGDGVWGDSHITKGPGCSPQM